MKYRIEISSVAETEADEAFLRLSQITSRPLVKIRRNPTPPDNPIAPDLD